MKLLSLPREVGKHPETGELITANFGRYGPYVAHNGQYASLESPEDVFTIGLNHAVTVLAEKRARGRAMRGPEPLKELGNNGEGKPVKLMKGRYGPYVSDGTTNATIPKDVDPNAVTLEQALTLIAERAAKGPSPKQKKKAEKAAAKAKKAKEAEATPKPETKTKAPAKKKAAPKTKKKPAKAAAE